MALGGYAAALTLGYVMGRFQRPAAGSPSGTKTGYETRADRRRFFGSPHRVPAAMAAGVIHELCDFERLYDEVMEAEENRAAA